MLNLPYEERQRFLELAVFARGTGVPEAAIVTLWTYTGHITERDARRLLVDFKQRSLIHLERFGETSKKPGMVSLHDLVHDFVLSAAERLAPKSALHEQLLGAYRRKCLAGWASGPNDGYFLSCLPFHLAESGRFEELVSLVLDRRWLEAKNGAGLAVELPADLSTAERLAPASDSRRVLLPLLNEALRRDIHFIARHSKDYPQALFQCMWNTCWWYDAPEAAEHCTVTNGRGEAPWNRPEPKLCTLLEKWRREREAEFPGFAWIRERRPPRVQLTGRSQTVLFGHQDRVQWIAFSPDGARVVTASKDQTARVWDVVSGTELLCLKACQELWSESLGADSAVFSADGGRLVTVARDAVRIWDASTGAELLALRVDDGRNRTASLSPDGGRVVTAIIKIARI